MERAHNVMQGERFNEAAGIHRRKRTIADNPIYRFSCFNEAAGIHRRKHLLAARQGTPLSRFNEAAGIHRRKHDYVMSYDQALSLLQ